MHAASHTPSVFKRLAARHHRVHAAPVASSTTHPPGAADGHRPDTARSAGQSRSRLLLPVRLAALLGRRRMFLTGPGVFTAASLASAMAGSATTLFAARAGQGLGAALLSPAALAIIMTAFQ